MKMKRYKLLLVVLLIVIGCDETVAPDTTAPTVVITYPVNATTLTATTTIKADVTDDSDISSVKFLSWGNTETRSYALQVFGSIPPLFGSIPHSSHETPVLNEDLGEFTPGAQRRAQGVLEEPGLKNGLPGTVMSLIGHWLILSDPQQAVTAQRISGPPVRMRIVPT